MWVASTLVLLAAGLGSAPPGEAAQEPNKIDIDRVIVTTTRRAVPEIEAPRSVDTVSKERRAELQARSLPEALEETDGVFIQRTNRGAGSPIIRGMVGPQNLIVVDGVRFNTSTFRTGPNQYLSLLDPTAMIRVEAVRGPSSVLYGNGAMGGVLHVLTDEPALAGEGNGTLWAGEASGHFGSADLGGGGSVWASGSVGDFGALIGGHYTHYGELRTGNGDTVPLSEYDAGHWRAKLLYTPSDWTFTAAYFGTVARDAGRTDSLGRGEVRQYDNDDHLAYLRVELTGADIFKRWRTTLSYHHLGERVDRANCGVDDNNVVADRDACGRLDESVFTKKRFNIDTVNTIGADSDVLLSFWQDRLNLSLGFDLYHDQVGSNREDASADDGFVFTPKARGNFSEGSTYLTLGAFAHADATIVRTPGLDLRLSGGIRYSHFDASAPDVPGLGDVGYAFDGAMGSIGIQLVVPYRFNLYATVLQGFRAPNLQETTLLGDTGNFFEVPNDTLGPETSHTLEVGSKLTWGPVTFSAAYYYTQLQNVIDREFTTFEGADEVGGKPVVQRVNTARGITQGVESSLALTLWRFTASGAFAWTKSDITDGDGNTTAGRRIPPVFGTTTLRYDHPDASMYIEVSARFAAAQDRLHPSDEKDHRICQTSAYSGVLQDDCDGTPAWATLSVRGGYRFHPNVRADVSISNLLDSNYRVHGSGYDAAGIDARATLTAAF